jgi:hypothetical protein
MIINFFDKDCQSISQKKRFGLCDVPPPAKTPAYIDEKDGSKWIAVVENEDNNTVTFTAIDNCIEIFREDGNMEKRCDGVLYFDKTIVFVELKERSARGNEWVKDAEQQLRTTILIFEKAEEPTTFMHKKAYIANSEHPKFKDSQSRRMNQFFEDTGYVLRIENRIRL